MTHSVMFHHFHDAVHAPAQGSLNADEFREMLTWLKHRFNTLSADDYASRFLSGKIDENDICISFDDALRCQYDIAVPILEELGLRAFFFVYSSAFSDDPDKLEIYRYFRTCEFSSVDEFYAIFTEFVRRTDEAQYAERYRAFKSADYLANFPFYTENDRWFRYLRDQVLGPAEYGNVMKDLMQNRNFDIEAAKSALWMTEEQLTDIHNKGHTVGLHSYSHPTQMSKLTETEQHSEYSRNYQHLSALLSPESITSMSHPCGDYGEETLKILRDLGMQIGFRSNMAIKEIKSALEIPREDHANVFKEMRQ